MIFEPWNDIDWLDQALHILAGFVIASWVTYFVSWWFGILTAMTVAVVREQIQHLGECHQGCRTDLLFWGVGSIGGAGMVLLLVGGE